jgi:Uma2 family endonuclease
MATEAVVHPPRTMMEIFKAIPEGTRVQLIQNQLVMSPAPSDTHQKVLGKLFKRLDDFVEENDLGEVRVAAYDVYLDEENAFQPDIVFVAKENIHKIQENGLHGAPDLVIEVLSPSNSSYDKKGKKEIYEKAGVKEYFIIEPYEKAVTFYKLVNDEFHEIEQTVGVLRSMLLETDIIF